ncbi:hypothetical protein RTBOTA2_000461 [Rhodotorula toruloides]|nr:hypothetical protein RTBOTA2_000461 [Rhodotorula toruloides]
MSVHTVLQVLDAHSHRLAKRAASFDEHSSPRPPPGSTAAGHLSAHMLRFRAHSPATSQGSGDEGERRGTAVLTFLAHEDRIGQCGIMQDGPAQGGTVAGLLDELCKGRCRGNFSVFARETGAAGFTGFNLETPSGLRGAGLLLARCSGSTCFLPFESLFLSLRLMPGSQT